MSGSPTFIEKHGLWSDEQKRLAAEIARRVEAEELRFVRLAWGDAHGYSRAKTLTVPAFLSALTGGYNIGVATTTLDSAGARVFASFTRGGGMGLDEMTGSPNLTIVADPSTFRALPWAQGVGWDPAGLSAGKLKRSFPLREGANNVAQNRFLHRFRGVSR